MLAADLDVPLRRLRQFRNMAARDGPLGPAPARLSVVVRSMQEESSELRETGADEDCPFGADDERGRKALVAGAESGQDNAACEVRTTRAKDQAFHALLGERSDELAGEE